MPAAMCLCNDLPRHWRNVNWEDKEGDDSVGLRKAINKKSECRKWKTVCVLVYKVETERTVGAQWEQQI